MLIIQLERYYNYNFPFGTRKPEKLQLLTFVLRLMPKMIYTGVESKNKVYLRNITERKRVTSLIQTRVAHNVNEFHSVSKVCVFFFFVLFVIFALLLFILFCFLLFTFFNIKTYNPPLLMHWEGTLPKRWKYHPLRCFPSRKMHQRNLNSLTVLCS